MLTNLSANLELNPNGVGSNPTVATRSTFLLYIISIIKIQTIFYFILFS